MDVTVDGQILQWTMFQTIELLRAAIFTLILIAIPIHLIQFNVCVSIESNQMQTSQTQIYKANVNVLLAFLFKDQ